MAEDFLTEEQEETLENNDGFFDGNFNEEEEDDNLTEFSNDSDYGTNGNHNFEEEEEEEEDTNKNKKINRSFFDKNDDAPEEESEEDNEEEDDDDEFLKKFNKKFKTDFKTADDVKKSLKEDDDKSALQLEKTKFENNNISIKRIKNYLNLKNYDLVKQDYITRYNAQKKDVNDPDVLEEIEDKISSLQELGELDNKADLIKDMLSNHLKKIENENSVLESKWRENEEKTNKRNRELLQDSLIELTADGDFFGVQIEKEDIKRVYKKITSNEFFDNVNKDQKSIATLALFMEYKDEILKNSTRPTHSDGVKSVLDEISGKKTQRSITKANNSTGGKTDVDHIKRFLQ